MNIKKLFCCLLCVLMLTVSLPLGVIAADPFSQWDLTGWTKGTDDGQTIIRGDSGAQMNLLWLKGTTTGNTEPVSDAPGTADVPAASDTEPGTAPARGCSSHLSSIAGLCVLLAVTAAALWAATGRKGKRA